MLHQNISGIAQSIKQKNNVLKNLEPARGHGSMGIIFFQLPPPFLHRRSYFTEW